MITIMAGKLELQLDHGGNLTSMKDRAGGQEYAAMERLSPFIRIVADGRMETPDLLDYNGESGILSFAFACGARIEMASESKERYATFEITGISGKDIDTLIWGPYATTVDGSIGESVGIVHNAAIAIGIQSLNLKTVGGWPLEWDRLDGVQSAYSDDGSARPDPQSRQPSDNKFDYDVCAAWPLSGGSLLQAFARNRAKAARRPVWNLPDIPVAPISGGDADIVGTKIALFGCSLEQVLDTIEAVELGEGLPHPLIEGVWGKKSAAANRSYLITDFSEATIGEAVRYTKKAGLRYVYHPDPFGQWGHFILKTSSFPNGDEGLGTAVGLAESEGVRVGLHTLANFTTMNDPYVTPIPDHRLQTTGMARLTVMADKDAQDMEVDDPRPFTAALFRRSARIGSELIEYSGVSEKAPWKLLGVKRGVNGTTASKHDASTEIGRLWDHPYDVFFPNLELQDHYSERIAELYRTTGVKQISFDGLEGVYASGQDGYGVNRFVKRCYDGWGDEVINDASFVVPNYLWHIFTRFNWGEPWGAATREGQLEWRLSNQRYFARNFIPPMLGWFLIRSASDKFEATARDEMEWVLSKAAGFQAGFALVADMAVLGRNGNREELLETVCHWENARQAGAFTAEQRERLREPGSDWHLEPVGEGRWELYPVAISRPLVCDPFELQPGQPGGADWAYFNKYAAQPLKFSMRVTPSYGNDEASVIRPTFYTDGAYMTFDTGVMANQYLVYEGGSTGGVYDLNWNLLKVVQASADAPIIRSGGQSVSFSCKFAGDPKPAVSVKIFAWGEPETVQAAEPLEKAVIHSVEKPEIPGGS